MALMLQAILAGNLGNSLFDFTRENDSIRPVWDWFGIARDHA